MGNTNVMYENGTNKQLVQDYLDILKKQIITAQFSGEPARGDMIDKLSAAAQLSKHISHQTDPSVVAPLVSAIIEAAKPFEPYQREQFYYYALGPISREQRFAKLYASTESQLIRDGEPMPNTSNYFLAFGGQDENKGKPSTINEPSEEDKKKIVSQKLQNPDDRFSSALSYAYTKIQPMPYLFLYPFEISELSKPKHEMEFPDILSETFGNSPTYKNVIDEEYKKKYGFTPDQDPDRTSTDQAKRQEYIARLTGIKQGEAKTKIVDLFKDFKSMDLDKAIYDKLKQPYPYSDADVQDLLAELMPFVGADYDKTAKKLTVNADSFLNDDLNFMPGQRQAALDALATGTLDGVSKFFSLLNKDSSNPLGVFLTEPSKAVFDLEDIYMVRNLSVTFTIGNLAANIDRIHTMQIEIKQQEDVVLESKKKYENLQAELAKATKAGKSTTNLQKRVMMAQGDYMDAQKKLGEVVNKYSTAVLWGAFANPIDVSYFGIDYEGWDATKKTFEVNLLGEDKGSKITFDLKNQETTYHDKMKLVYGMPIFVPTTWFLEIYGSFFDMKPVGGGFYASMRSPRTGIKKSDAGRVFEKDGISGFVDPRFGMDFDKHKQPSMLMELPVGVQIEALGDLYVYAGPSYERGRKSEMASLMCGFYANSYKLTGLKGIDLGAEFKTDFGGKNFGKTLLSADFDQLGITDNWPVGVRLEAQLTMLKNAYGLSELYKVEGLPASLQGWQAIPGVGAQFRLGK